MQPARFVVFVQGLSVRVASRALVCHRASRVDQAVGHWHAPVCLADATVIQWELWDSFREVRDPL